VGLEQVRRGAVLYKQLETCDPIMCTSDYRAATFARDLGVYRGIGVDIIGNLPNIMERNDMLIFDSDEPSDTMRTFMAEYCTHLYEVGVDIPKTLVDDQFFKGGDKSIEKSFFFGDDDYGDILLKELCKNQTKQDIKLLMGHYFFLGNEEKLSPYFDIIEEDQYFETILNTKYLLTSSINAAFESLASGNKPVFYPRIDKENKDLDLIKEYNIPIINGKNIMELVNNFDNTIQNYPETKTLEKVDTAKIINEISSVIEKFKAVVPSLESNY
jgi:hypothetical protein